LCTVEEYALPCAMTKEPGWVSAQKAQELLGIDRKTLFKYRDDGTLTLGTHFAAFPGCMSRDGYRWNVAAVRKHLNKIERQQAKMAMEVC
jgi:hypothetical protein